MKCKKENCNLNLMEYTGKYSEFCIAHRAPLEREDREKAFFEKTGKNRIEVSDLFGENCYYDDDMCSTKVYLTPEQVSKIKGIL